MVEKGEWQLLQQPIQNWSVDAVANSLSFLIIGFIFLSLQVAFGFVETGQKGDTIGILGP